MFVKQLIGRNAGEVVEMPYTVAQSAFANGTVERATELEIIAAGFQPVETMVAGAVEHLPRGYSTVLLEPRVNEAGYDVYWDRSPERLNNELLPNLAAARSFANTHHAAQIERQNEDLARLSAVVIPDLWSELKAADVVAIARKIVPEVKSREEAIGVIEAELQRRKLTPVMVEL